LKPAYADYTKTLGWELYPYPEFIPSSHSAQPRQKLLFDLGPVGVWSYRIELRTKDHDGWIEWTPMYWSGVQRGYSRKKDAENALQRILRTRGIIPDPNREFRITAVWSAGRPRRRKKETVPLSSPHFSYISPVFYVKGIGIPFSRTPY
jgi:hypothetical protein